MPKIELTKEVQHEDQQLTEIELDLDSLTGDDLIQAETEYTTMNGTFTSVPELSKTYLMHVAARAAKLPVETIRALSAKDASRVTMEVQNFLLG